MRKKIRRVKSKKMWGGENMGVKDSWDDKDTAMIVLGAFGIITIIILAIAPKDIALQMVDKFAPVWTAIVGALGGIATGKGKE